MTKLLRDLIESLIVALVIIFVMLAHLPVFSHLVRVLCLLCSWRTLLRCLREEGWRAAWGVVVKFWREEYWSDDDDDDDSSGKLVPSW